MLAPFFLSYAHADAADVDRFRNVFQPLLRSSAKYQFSPWADYLILPGEQWRSEIDQALERCRFGLLLASPNFLASPFITENELPALLSKPMVVPVALHQILFNGLMDLKGLDCRLVFHDAKGRPFDACGTMRVRRDFALELYTKIVALLEKYPC